MKITDETKKFTGDSDFGAYPKMRVSSNYWGTHETPSVCLRVTHPTTFKEVAFGTEDQSMIIEIIEHMAKMGGLEVSIKKRFEPKYQPGDRVRSLAHREEGIHGTVLSDIEDRYGWNVAVRLDGNIDHGLFTYDELEPVTKSS